MKRILIIAFIPLLILSTLACQPTPAEEIVVNKGDGVLEEAIASTPAPTMKATEITQWTETYALTNLTVHIDAEIALPDLTQYPVYMLEKSSFTVARINQAVDFFTKGATGMRETSDTLEELQELWLAAKRGCYAGDGMSDEWLPYEGQEEEIARLEAEMQTVQAEAFVPLAPLQKAKAQYSYALSNGDRVHMESHSNLIIYAQKSKSQVCNVSIGIIGSTRWWRTRRKVWNDGGGNHCAGGGCAGAGFATAGCTWD